MTPYSEAHKAVQAALAELFRLVRLEYETIENETPRTKRIAAVARALCRLDHDMIVTGIPGGVACMGAKNTVVILHPIMPAWATFWSEAETALHAVEKAE